jgi:thiol-disulfide isomerase/thioredoxin
MNKQVKTFLYAAGFVAFLIFALIAYNLLSASYEPGMNAEPESGVTVAAPDFTVYDKDGTAVKLSDFKGKPVVLNFWASWCGYCKEEMPYFDAVNTELDGEVVFLMVNATDGQRETREKADAYLAKSGYAFSTYYDTDASAVRAYQINAFPTSYFIDKDGNIRHQVNGMITEKTLRKYVADIAA